MSDDFENGLVHYWDVFPKSLKLSFRPEGPPIPLSIRGNPEGYIEFESYDEYIAYVDEDGYLWPGWEPGATIIMVTAYGLDISVRYVQVEIIDYNAVDGGGDGGGEEEYPPEEY